MTRWAEAPFGLKKKLKNPLTKREAFGTNKISMNSSKEPLAQIKPDSESGSISLVPQICPAWTIKHCAQGEESSTVYETIPGDNFSQLL